MDEIWQIVLQALSGISIGAILTAIIVGIVKGSVSKIVTKINAKKISEDAVDKGMERIKEVTFTHSIQPIAEEGLKKIIELNDKALKEYFDRMTTMYLKLVQALEEFTHYYDGATIPAETREKLQKAIDSAKDFVLGLQEEPNKVEAIPCEVVVEEAPKEEKKKEKTKITI